MTLTAADTPAAAAVWVTQAFELAAAGEFALAAMLVNASAQDAATAAAVMDALTVVNGMYASDARFVVTGSGRGFAVTAGRHWTIDAPARAFEEMETARDRTVDSSGRTFEA